MGRCIRDPNGPELRTLFTPQERESVTEDAHDKKSKRQEMNAGDYFTDSVNPLTVFGSGLKGIGGLMKVSPVRQQHIFPSEFAHQLVTPKVEGHAGQN